MDYKQLAEGLQVIVTYKTADDEESRKAGDQVEHTTTIDFGKCTLEEVAVFAAETVKIRQLQTRLRNGKVIPDVWEASRPGARGSGLISKETMLRKLCGTKYEAILQKYGSVDAAYTALKSFLDDEADDIN